MSEEQTEPQVKVNRVLNEDSKQLQWNILLALLDSENGLSSVELAEKLNNNSPDLVRARKYLKAKNLIMIFESKDNNNIPTHTHLQISNLGVLVAANIDENKDFAKFPHEFAPKRAPYKKKFNNRKNHSNK